jgi:hypothetical protein
MVVLHSIATPNQISSNSKSTCAPKLGLLILVGFSETKLTSKDKKITIWISAKKADTFQKRNTTVIFSLDETKAHTWISKTKNQTL